MSISNCMACAAILVEQDAAGRRVEIVELTATYRPCERRDRAARDEQRERKHDVERDHFASLNARVRKEFASTVSELTGMSRAAISG